MPASDAAGIPDDASFPSHAPGPSRRIVAQAESLVFEPGAQRAILREQVVDDLLPATVQPAREPVDEEDKGEQPEDEKPADDQPAEEKPDDDESDDDQEQQGCIWIHPSSNTVECKVPCPNDQYSGSPCNP